MEISFLLFAFSFGLLFKQLGVPPLVGYLIAGFVLQFMGFSATLELQALADLGITIMLFTIGLKLNVKDLTKKEIWASCTAFTLIWTAIVSALLVILTVLLSNWVPQISFNDAVLVAFALSFSSTVCVVKVLEESGEMKTRHGRLAIGILVMQDIFAVVFLVAATGKLPSPYALLLVLLVPMTPIIRWVLNKSGHGELLPLTGFVYALGAYHLFELVNVKGDLGALVAGVLIASHFKASELAKSLLSFKDLFLIGFFLSIGLIAPPTLTMAITALVLCAFIFVKALLFFGLLTAFRLRGRTSFLSTLVLSNYSEFGLIVGSLAVSLGLLHSDWLVIMALAVSFSFVITSLSYRRSHSTYTQYKLKIRRFEKPIRLAEDEYPTLTDASFLVVGMGRVGLGAHQALSKVCPGRVVGMDADSRKIRKLELKKISAILGDGEDIDLWENLDLSNIKLVLLALPSIEDTSNITRQLKHAGFNGKIAAIARYEDEVNHLLENGVDKVFNFFVEAGVGFAEESLQFVGATALKEKN